MPFNWSESNKDRNARRNNSHAIDRKKIETQEESTERLLGVFKKLDKKKGKR